MTPIHRRGRLAAFKIEGTPGTAESLTGSEGTTILMNTSVTPEISSTDQPAQGSLNYHASIIESRGANVSTTLPWRGSGTAATPPSWASLLKACGMTQTTLSAGVSWVPLLGNTQTVTFAQYQGGVGASGRRKMAAGCMFDLTLTLETGKAPMMALNGKGCWQALATTTNPSPTYVTTKPPIFTGATLTWGGSAIKCAKVELKMNNRVELREDATTATGYSTAWIADIRPTITVDPEADTATDFYANHLASTTAALVCSWGSTAGNSGTLTASALQIVDPVGDEDRKGMEVDSLTALCTGTSLFTLTHT